ncbi:MULTISPECIES: N-acetylmuramate alpha-1-phosphate uridylyltransferase MurU [Gammaproteobacteria]|uniref:N-acetylmuramate alpha-1-phosphate uridylyltransferase MurU n=1 Tax=Gammaproteobacteria TaxID=1236 RepID=UPI000DCFC539|nr:MULTISPECIES: nucleotidyltransferase family protein [Gammaproteobacteria]RTE85619.1 nucleotidyltransferase family protein [Aliidiomarina sp. B3213]TCZ89588.1 nucleotidyltransferase family protein [Lysobacter sp. N42]
MKTAMILAAGRGKRMQPLTDHCPKPLLKVGGKPLIVWHIEKLKRMGVTDIVINVAWLPQQVISTLGGGERWGVNIHYSEEPEGGLETAGGIVRALPMLGDAPFIVVNGDIWTDFDFQRFPELPSDELAHLVLVENPSHNESGDFGLVQNKVVNSGARYTFSGMSVLRPELFTGITDSFLALKPIFDQAITGGYVSGQLYQGAWTDVGTPERLQAINASIEESE